MYSCGCCHCCVYPTCWPTLLLAAFPAVLYMQGPQMHGFMSSFLYPLQRHNHMAVEVHIASVGCLLHWGVCVNASSSSVSPTTTNPIDCGIIALLTEPQPFSISLIRPDFKQLSVANAEPSRSPTQSCQGCRPQAPHKSTPKGSSSAQPQTTQGACNDTNPKN